MGTVIHIPKRYGPIQDRRGYFDPREQAVDAEFGFLYGPCPSCIDGPGYTCASCGFYCERCICLPKADEARRPLYVRLLEASLRPDAAGHTGWCVECGLPMSMHLDVTGTQPIYCEGAKTRHALELYENRPAKS